MFKSCLSFVVFVIMLALFFFSSALCYIAGAKYGKQYVPEVVCKYVGL